MSRKTPKPSAANLETLSALQSGHSRLEEVSAALSLSSLATKDRLSSLKAKGYAETIKGGKTWRITPEGMAALENAAKNSPPVSLENSPQELPKGSDNLVTPLPTPPDELKPLEPPKWLGLQALEGWLKLMATLPLPEFRAALRLVLAVALLRNRAPKLSPMPWIGLYGSTGTGKSTIAECARVILGGHYFQVGTMTTGEAQGRRSSKPPYTLETPPRTLAGAVTDLDELAEAPESLRTALYALMQRADGYVTIEGQDFENRAAIVATWNPTGRDVPLPVGALRRGLLMDTTPFKRRLEKAFSLEMIGVDIRAALEMHPAPWLNIQHIPAPVPIVDRTTLEQAQRTLYSVLKNPSDHPLPALSGLGSAYAVLFCLSEESALTMALTDFATLAATKGETISTWRDTLQQQGNPIDTTEPEDNQTDPAALVRQDLELRARQAHTVQRAATPRDQLRKHYNHLAPNEREIAAPILAKLEKIGQGAANANLNILEVYITELDTLEHQAVQFFHVAESRMDNEKQAAQAAKQNEARRLEDTKQQRQAMQQQAKSRRDSAKSLRQAVAWKDSALESDRAKHRKKTIAWCYQHYLESRNPPQLPRETGQGWLANVARQVENNRRAFTQYSYERGTNRQVWDIDKWMTEKAVSLENQAAALERGDTRALAPVQNARALPSSAPAQVLPVQTKRYL